MIYLGISFDDGLMDCFKWSRGMFSFGIRGIFYVCPKRIDTLGFLKTYSLDTMVNEWNHVIANHTWDHEAPKVNTFAEIMDSLKKSTNWLMERDYAYEHLALPYGVRGGGWEDLVELLKERGYILRDVRFKGEKPGTRDLPSAIENTEEELIDEERNYLYFHHNKNTRDDKFVQMLERAVKLRDDGKLTFFPQPENGE